jgi:hypothetical protein
VRLPSIVAPAKGRCDGFYVKGSVDVRKSQAKNSENQHNISHFTNSKSSMKNPHNPDVDTMPAQPLFINTLFCECFLQENYTLQFHLPRPPLWGERRRFNLVPWLK